jgi:hypothetical protein
LREALHGIDPATAKYNARTADTFEEPAGFYLERYAKAEKRHGVKTRAL